MKEKLQTPLLFDGAMGTYYNSIVDNPLPACEMANLFDRDNVIRIHREYIQAGANAIKTNTFGANTASLQTDFDVVKQVITKGVELAEEAATPEVMIFASIGQIPGTPLEAQPEYFAIVDLFLELGIRHFLFETFSLGEQLPQIAAHIKEADAEAIVLVSFAVQPDGFTRQGASGEALLEEMAKVDAIDGVGFNCISGPYHLQELVKSIHLPKKTLSIMPNAGYPTVVGNRTYYSDNASYFARITAGFLDYGFAILGGCCGTTPDHIAKLAQAMENQKSAPVASKPRARSERLETEPTENLFYKKLLRGKKVIAVEYDPPAGVDIKGYMTNVKTLKDAGVDAITIADCPVGRARFDSSLMAYKIKNEIGIDPIVHLTCRDRNLNATKALLLGLNVENILNLILVTGDPIPTADRGDVQSVFHFNSSLLTQYVEKLNTELFTNPMVPAMALNLNAPNFGAELKRALYKESMGAKVFFTQPVVSELAVRNLQMAREALSAKLMGGIIPVISHKNAVFMNEEIAGIRVENSIIESYMDLDREKATQKAVEFSLHFIQRIEDYVDGYYLITPFNRVDVITKILSAINPDTGQFQQTSSGMQPE
ncbi:MAG: bifunctional homocysteine S-methyltransferase/methylenetetrahydrofolate reductase [Tissierellia bacterium]|nr:bifunctional homocysteine S-methyltransferase/methylenetetrahydrofolate reductase [Tissierellia bacterium]